MLSIKKQIVALSLSISFVALAGLAVAESPATRGRPEAPGAQEMMKKEKLGKEMMGKDKIKLFGEKAVLRLTVALNRADGFLERVTRHARQFSNPRFDLVMVEQKLAETKEAIMAGRLAVSAAQIAMTNALTVASTTSSSSFTDVRIKIREAMEAVRAAHQKIIEAIRLIKAGYGYPGIPIPPGQATTTP